MPPKLQTQKPKTPKTLSKFERDLKLLKICKLTENTKKSIKITTLPSCQSINQERRSSSPIIFHTRVPIFTKNKFPKKTEVKVSDEDFRTNESIQKILKGTENLPKEGPSFSQGRHEDWNENTLKEMESLFSICKDCEIMTELKNAKVRGSRRPLDQIIAKGKGLISETVKKFLIFLRNYKKKSEVKDKAREISTFFEEKVKLSGVFERRFEILNIRIQEIEFIEMKNLKKELLMLSFLRE